MTHLNGKHPGTLVSQPHVTPYHLYVAAAITGSEANPNRCFNGSLEREVSHALRVAREAVAQEELSR